MNNLTNIPTKNASEEFKSSMVDFVNLQLNDFEKNASGKMIPTGIQENIIFATAGVKGYKKNTQVVEIVTANKVGKTATLIGGILKNIFWEPDEEFYNYPIFKKWPYPKHGRIVGTSSNVADAGPIRQEILKWWPESKYKCYYKSKRYYSYYEIEGKDGTYTFDVMSFDQHREEFEGPLKGWTLVDEPPKTDLLGAIFSRFSEGGIFFLGMTPIEAGIVLDVIEDMESRGVVINRVRASIYDNSATKGLWNSNKTKCGLMTEEQIKNYIPTIPPDEVEARLYGKASAKSGKIYPMFDRTIHVRDYDLTSSYMKRANHYMVMDPHPKYYPFMQWWAITEDEKYICYNEWPMHNTLKAYYDEIRQVKPCPHSIENLAGIIRVQDLSHIGYKILKRFIDPLFAKGSENEYTKKTLGIVAEFVKPPNNLEFSLPPVQKISVQRERIRNMLSYNKDMPVNSHNEPNIFYMPNCRNSIRAIDRHSWGQKGEFESELHKDPMDCTRMFLAGVDGLGFIAPEKPKQRIIKEPSITDTLSDINLV